MGHALEGGGPPREILWAECRDAGMEREARTLLAGKLQAFAEPAALALPPLPIPLPLMVPGSCGQTQWPPRNQAKVPLSFAASESLRRIPSCCCWLWPCSLHPQGEQGPEEQGLRMGKILAGWGPSESTTGLPSQASICPPLCRENDMRLLSDRSLKSLILHGRFSGELADRVGADEASHWALDPGGSPPPPLSTPLPAQTWE